MRFQFLCPNGHLLEAEIAHAGLSCQCPHCGVLFVIPPTTETARAPADEVVSENMHEEVGIPRIEVLPQFDPSESADDEAMPEVFEGGPRNTLSVDGPAEPAVVHVLCPGGHELKTPIEMLGSEALCPLCQARFQLRYEDSRECREERARAQARREERLGRLWLTWAIVAAAVVLGGMILMILAFPR